MTRSVLIAALFVVSVTANAEPLVEGIDLVSATRVDRTRFDYTYALRMQGDSRGYEAASVSVQIAPGVVGTTIVKPNVDIGRIDAGEFMRTSDVFVLRQDRQQPFNRANLKFTFNGRPAAVSTASNNSLPSIGPVALLERSPVPGHSATVAALHATDPVAGRTVLARASLFGPVASAEYSLRSRTGVLLAAGNLLRSTPESEWFYSSFVVPGEDFTLSILARAPAGQTVAWESKRYQPAPASLRLIPDSAILNFGKPMRVRLEYASASGAEQYDYELKVPAGFTVSNSSGTVLATASPGVVNLTVTPPTSGAPFRFHTLTVQFRSKSNPAAIRSASLQVIVE